ncbi:MAG: MFS transporter [Aeromicrobium sp.]|uniref:MFS transporter n=1 Tax=Aeromicrobium sp. TaxID=1871063 RepID=UPI0039E24919
MTDVTALPGRVRRGYALGGVATGAFSTVPGLLLLPYLTDTLGVTAAVAGVVVFVPKVWDAVLNPISGRVSDRSTHPAGRRRAFLLPNGIALAACFALMFAGPTSPTVGSLWVVVMFLACATAYSFFQVPYVAMPAELTLDYDERTKLMTWRVVVLALAILLSGATAPMVVEMVGEDSASGYRVMGAYVAVVIAAGAVGAWWGTKGAPEHRVATPAEGVMEQLRIVARSVEFRPLMTAYLVQTLALGTMLAGTAYVAADVLHRPLASTALFVAFIGPALAVTPMWERVARRGTKRDGYAQCSLVLVVGMLVMGLGLMSAPWLLYVGAGVVGVGYAGSQVFPLAMLPDVAAHDAERSGENRVGVFTGVWSAGETAGMAVGPALFALVLTLGGYVSSTADVEVTQPGSAVVAIGFGFTVIPAVLTALSLLALRHYRLDEELRRGSR